MKKIITIMLVFVLAFSTLTVSTFAASSSKGPYVKVKKATYEKYKKAYKKNTELTAKVKELKAEIETLKANGETVKEVVKTVTVTEPADTSAYEKEIAELKAENESLKTQLTNSASNDDIDELKHRLSQQEDINDWLWMTLKSLGIKYTNKTWTVPTSYPSTFMINGTKYVVLQEEE